MSPKFTCSFELSKKKYDEYSAGMDRTYKRVWRIYVLGFAAFFMVLAIGFWEASKLAVIIVGAIAVACVLTAFFGYKINARMNYSRLEYFHKGAPLMKVAFGDEKIENNTQLQAGSITYSHINRIFQTKNLVVLVIENEKQGHQSVIVDKTAIEGGSVDELIAYVGEKCVNVHVNKPFSFLRTPK